MDLTSQLEFVGARLADLGYRQPTGNIVSNYTYLDAAGKSKTVDLMAFGDPVRTDISTACIAVEQWPNEADKKLVLSHLRYAGAPIAIFVMPETVEIWPVNASPEVAAQRQEELSYEEVIGYLHARGRELAPRSLLSAKLGERQLSFFEIDPHLIDFARNATQEVLVRQFELALRSTPKGIREKFPKELTHLAIWILAARILQDKLVNYEDLQTKNVSSLLGAAKRRFPNYFTTLDRDLSVIGRGVADHLYNLLSGEFTFRSLTNDMLAYFYENTLVQDNVRKELGIYYTPRSLAQRMLRRLPIEDFAPQERTVFDGTCGSGNLLLAAYDRISALLPNAWSLDQKHVYLLQHIWGIDQDPFACEVARLSLLLYNLPAGDSWQIRTGDVMLDTPQQVFGSRPNIIVGNPPFEELRARAGARQVQKAGEIVDRYLDWLAPDGLLGVVLPITFLHNKSTLQLREKLLRVCDILEIWHLPEGAIPGSSAAISVILARKIAGIRTEAQGLTRVEEESRVNYHQTGFSREAPISYVVPQTKWLTNPQRRLVSSSFDAIWEGLERDFPAIHPNYGYFRNGVMPGKPAREKIFRRDQQGIGWRPGLIQNTSGKVLQPYAIAWERQELRYILYPSPEIERSRNPEHFTRAEKVVVNATRNSGSPWRFYAAIDEHRLVVTANFHYVLPISASVEELAAVLNSTVANAWFSSRNYHRDVTLNGGLKRLPFPNFNRPQKQKVREVVRTIMDLKSMPALDSQVVRDLENQLDEIVFEAFAVGDRARQRIRDWMIQFPRPGDEWTDLQTPRKIQSAYSGRYWILTGEVQDIDPNKQTVSIWLEGHTDSITIPIPTSMPGWALRPGAAFQALTPWGQRDKSDFSDLTWVDFQPLDMGYLSDDDLVLLLNERGS